MKFREQCLLKSELKQETVLNLEFSKAVLISVDQLSNKEI